MRPLAVLGVLCALGGGIAATRATGAGAEADSAGKRTGAHGALAGIHHFRNVTWHWQRLTHVPPTRASSTAERSPDPRYRRWVLRLWQHRAAQARAHAAHWLTERIRDYRATVSHWQRVMGLPPTRRLAAAGGGVAGLERSYRFWKRQAHAIVRRAQHPPYAAQFLCIHRYEGSWTDPGSPYFGGLQMSLTFQQRYGGYLLRTKGTADHWTPLEQMWVAARAARSGRGFSPWPNTARACGLY